ncbi:MAG TPA: hypothetical protein VLA12_09605 [Planctomycetaceae bacterium]|nr:hypothetical protein [Planctomycetaceae bacterium]
MNEQAWIQFWKAVLIVGLGSYFLLALAIIPFGARDILRLFRKLDRPDADNDESLE